MDKETTGTVNTSAASPGDLGSSGSPLFSLPPNVASSPGNRRGHIVFLTLAGNQTDFYVPVSAELRNLGYDSEFLSFHERSLKTIRDGGFSATSVFEVASNLKRADGQDPIRTCEEFGIENTNRLISHEKLFYGTTNTVALLHKFADYLLSVKSTLAEIRNRTPSKEKVVVVQELGGFLSVIATYYAARKLGIDNVFIEPSFFRGRLFFNRNSFGAAKVTDSGPRPTLPEVHQYLKETLDQKKIVIPIKDQGFYRKSFAKVLSWRNAKRLVQKTLEKHVRGQREEFNHLWHHVISHLRMARNEFLFHRYYRSLPSGRRLVYYPLHVPADVALTVRAPEYVDQWALIDYLARAIPASHLLVIKEHPATIGAASYSRVTDVLKRHDNVVLLNPRINNYDVIRESEAVVTVNSKSGAEPLLLGKPVIALGDSFYRTSGLVRSAASLIELPALLTESLRHADSRDRQAAVERFFQEVWDLSYPGELYSTQPAHAKVFAESLARYLTQAEDDEHR